MLYGLTLGGIAFILLFVLAGCSYGHKQYDPCASNGRPASDGLLVLEVTDYGRFWDRTANDRLYEFLENETAGRNVVLVTFIHGWHHNAELSDDNRRDFQRTVRELQEKVNTREYADSRVALQLQEKVEVIGLYIGWRGQSLPSFLDYLTFWGRKAAAERVGSGDLREFLLNLNKLYKKRNYDSPNTFMGMVTIGHSFGGQVALRTVAELLENDLIYDGVHSDGVQGLGDLTVLLNPAVEAHQYERIYRIAKKDVKFPAEQSPVMLTVSADNDWARSYWFPVGRWVSRLFRASMTTEEEAQEWTQALGAYEPQHTHRFTVTKQAHAINEDSCSQMDFSKLPAVDRVVMQNIPGRSNSNHPFIVASTKSTELLDGHNGIFNERFRSFLAEYVALSQGKRICVRREAMTPPPKQ